VGALERRKEVGTQSPVTFLATRTHELRDVPRYWALSLLQSRCATGGFSRVRSPGQSKSFVIWWCAVRDALPYAYTRAVRAVSLALSADVDV
jgi:hypothetical protein